ncbi:MAG TPA: TerC family protein [Herpetosiphonaceae bacterium]|nr:TerC family protein [Herpetosiphonaceae bacterium]
MLSEMVLVWVGFNLFVLAMLAIDLGIFHREAHSVSIKEAASWTVVWISLALVFAAGIYVWRGAEKALEFTTGYLIEYALSADNIFVFVLIFSFFSVPALYQHRVLFWGILGALLMRGTLIGIGAALIERFHWIIYVFGAFLFVTGIRMATHKTVELHPQQNPLVKLFRRIMPVTDDYQQDRFFVRRAGKLIATPLFIVLLIVESTDLVFAVDSIPAIFAVTLDPFIVYTSNVFAILGLRSLYFLLAGAVDKFHYLKLGLSAILTFVGMKMLLADLYKVPIAYSLLVIVALLAIAIIASVMRARRLMDQSVTEDQRTHADTSRRRAG